MAEVALGSRIAERVAATRTFLGMGLLRFQVVLLAMAIAIGLIIGLLVGQWNFVTSVIYTLVSGNVMTVLMSLAGPVLDQPFPRDWIVYLCLLFPVSAVSSTIASVLVGLSLRIPLGHLSTFVRQNVPFGMLMSYVAGIGINSFANSRKRMAEEQSRLVEEIEIGRRQLESHVSELQAAFEIQSNLLPKSIPQVPGVEIACAWQPAKTVSGDFFDVLVLGERTIGFCLADVSGKGISAALLTANLQALFRAVAPTETSPARVCEKLNEALRLNMPAGRFVTMVYGILERSTSELRYAVAGHAPPVLLRGRAKLTLEDGGPVLGLLPDVSYEDRVLRVQVGDRLLLPTDGVTEAFNDVEEEFGEQGMIEAAEAAKNESAAAMRTAVMDAVRLFTAGNFHDDASLMVIGVTAY